MNYKKTHLNLKNPLSFWLNFDDNEIEKVFWLNAQTGEYIIGAEHSDSAQAPFNFYSQSFFDKKSDGYWTDFGNQLIAFKHYFHKTTSQSDYYYLDDKKDIQEHEILKTTHSITEQTSSQDYENWLTAFSAIQDSIAKQETVKVVGSRIVDFKTEQDFKIESILQNLIDNNPSSFIFAYQKNGKCFIGATPEILIQKQDDKILSYALAGTISKTNPDAGEWLLNDPKNRQEHQIVVNAIRGHLEQYEDDIQIGQTDLMELKNVYHLRTILEAKSDRSLINWAKIFHPTPALGGQPQKAAMNLLEQIEPHDRGLFASPLGMIDAKGNGTLVVGIRSALIEKQVLHAFAGCGIVAASDAESEYKEISLKLKTILEAL